MEDYCHAVEHSIEFQVMFLQSIFGPDIKVLPDPVRVVRPQHLSRRNAGRRTRM